MRIFLITPDIKAVSTNLPLSAIGTQGVLKHKVKPVQGMKTYRRVRKTPFIPNIDNRVW
jgi:hypothetical protein